MDQSISKPARMSSFQSKTIVTIFVQLSSLTMTLFILLKSYALCKQSIFPLKGMNCFYVCIVGNLATGSFITHYNETKMCI